MPRLLDARPLKNIEELWAWEEPEIDPVLDLERWRSCASDESGLEAAGKQYIPRLTPLKEMQETDGNRQLPCRQELLVCHDFMGGYHDYEKLAGAPVDERTAFPFQYYHWWLADYFCYFSHCFITIPPPAYTDLAHKHDVRVLGTLITENDEGMANLRTMLADDGSMERAISRLVAITRSWQFDGWLINIENALDKEIEFVDRVRVFVQKLREALRKELKTRTFVIWYDSVTHDGELDWQNALNEKNCMYYDSSDGIFLNYNWKDEHLEKSAACASSACRGNSSVFVGIDVFARGCVGGWDSYKSVQKCVEGGFSMAIFAPGWYQECFPRDQAVENSFRFWSSIGREWPHRRPIAALPITTTFCNGFSEVGKHFRVSSVDLQPQYPVEEEKAEHSEEKGPTMRPTPHGLLLSQPGEYVLFHTASLPMGMQTTLRLESNKADTDAFEIYLGKVRLNCTTKPSPDGSSASHVFRVPKKDCEMTFNEIRVVTSVPNVLLKTFDLR